MKPFMVIRDPEAYKLLADETRRKMLYLLRVKEMNASQIAEQLGITSQAVRHHIRKLLKGKMVEVVREERIGHLIESYYLATAEDFLLRTGKISSQTLHDRELAQEQVTTVLTFLKNTGFDLEFDDSTISQLVDLRVGIEECCGTPEKSDVEDKIWDSDELNLLVKVMASDYLGILLMSDQEFNEKQKMRKSLRTLLRSLIRSD